LNHLRAACGKCVCCGLQTLNIGGRNSVHTATVNRVSLSVKTALYSPCFSGDKNSSGTKHCL